MIILVIEAEGNAGLVASVLQEYTRSYGMDYTVQGQTVRGVLTFQPDAIAVVPWSLVGRLSALVEEGLIKSVYITK